MSKRESECDSGDEGTSTGIKIKKPKYDQVYKTAWKDLPEFKGWLCESKKGSLYAFCKCCNKDIVTKSGKDSLLKHSISKAHVAKVQAILIQKPISSFTTTVVAEQRKIEYDIKEGMGINTYQVFKKCL